jgi:hypothetical protein
VTTTALDRQIETLTADLERAAEARAAGTLSDAELDVLAARLRELAEIALESAPAERRAQHAWMAGVVDKFVAHGKRIRALEAQIAERNGEQQRSAFSLADAHCGTWSADRLYVRDNIVVWDKGTWLCLRNATGEVPGTSDAWRILAGRGRDGRDRR